MMKKMGKMKLFDEIKKSRPADVITAAAFCAAIFALAILTFALPQKDFSENENRALATSGGVFGGMSAAKVFDGSFESEIADLYRDQCPARAQMLGIRAVSDRILLLGETGGVIYGKSGYMIPRPDGGTDAAEKNLAAVEAFRAAVEGDGKTFVFAAAPRPADALYPYYPAGYRGSELSAAREAVFPACSYATDLLEVLRPSVDAGDYVYYRTDHHWTTEGAYLASCEILRLLGKEPVDRSLLTVETASDSFLGTTHSKTLDPFATADRIEYYRFEGDGEYTTLIVDTGREFDGFYDRSFLETKDKYSSFFGGNNGRIRVTKKGAGEGDREVLLVVKDSYAHAVLPFLAYYYDLDVVDPRYYMSSVYRTSAEDGCSAVLILCGIDTVAGSPALARVSFGTGK